MIYSKNILTRNVNIPFKKAAKKTKLTVISKSKKNGFVKLGEGSEQNDAICVFGAYQAFITLIF